MSTYKSKYKEVELLDSYEVDHMSLREDMIRQDWIFDDYHKACWDSEWLSNESEYFINKVREVIKGYSEAEIKLYRQEYNYYRILFYHMDRDIIVGIPASGLFDLLRIKHN